MNFEKINNKLLCRIIVQGKDDWISYAELRGIFTEWASDVDIKTTNAVFISLIEKLLTQNILLVGDVTTNKGFIPWDGNPIEQTRRIEQSSNGRDEFVPGDICWFNLTRQGEQLIIQ